MPGRTEPSLPPPRTLKTCPPPAAVMPRTATWAPLIVPTMLVETIVATSSGVVSTIVRIV